MSTPPSSASHCAITSASSSSSGGASTCKHARTSVGHGSSSLECALERARTDALRFQQEALDSRNQSALAVHYLALAHSQAHTLAADKAQALEDTRRCKEQLRGTQALLAEEQIRAKNLESEIAEWKLAVRKKDERLEEYKSKGRRAQKALKNQNETLLRKATLPWILACLSNPYIEAETSKERIASLMRMAQDLLQLNGQSSSAAQNLCTFSNMKAKGLRLECAHVENEIRHLLYISNSSLRSSSEDCDSFEVPSRTSEPPTTRSLKDEGTDLLFDMEGMHRSRREHCKGCNPTSIPKTAQDLLHNEDGSSCAAPRDHSESHTKDSGFGWDIHGATVKKKYMPTRVRVPPLDIPGNKLTGAEIPSSFEVQHGGGTSFGVQKLPTIV